MKTLLWVAAMDSVLMAEKAKVFEQRLCKILGPETQVFPGLEQQGVPPYTVHDLAADIYILRNQIAHGGVILQRFLNLPPVSFNRSVKASYPGLLSYADVLHEASVVLLCGLLRHIVLKSMLSVFMSPKQWKRFLETS